MRAGHLPSPAAACGHGWTTAPPGFVPAIARRPHAMGWTLGRWQRQLLVASGAAGAHGSDPLERGGNSEPFSDSFRPESNYLV